MKENSFWKNSRKIYRLLIVVCAIMVVLSILALYFMPATLWEEQLSNSEYTDRPEDIEDPNKIVDGIHVRTGLIEAEGLMAVVNNCTSCHSAQLVIQNRMERERWISTIRWMQKTQNLWDLGDNEDKIVNYLVTNYPPIKKGRREVLTNIEWYELKD